MGLRDRFTDALGSAFGGGVSILTEALSKANSARDDEPSARGGGSQAMVSAAPKVPVKLPQQPSDQDPTSLLYDPFALVDQLGFRDKPGGLTYGILREMSRKTPVYTGVMQTRLTQVSSFAQRQKDPTAPGFGVILRDDKKHPTRVENKRLRQLEDWLLQTGTRWSPGRDDFRSFLKKLTRDSLELDQACFEIVRNRRGEPSEFYAVDGATIRIADVPPNMASTQDPNEVRYVQLYDEIRIAEYAAQDLCFGVRNPRSDLRCNGYGCSELEMMINVITATLYSFDYNKRAFSQGSFANGLLNFKGTMPQEKLESFRRQWKMMVSGVGNAHRVPMTNSDEIQWIDFNKSNRDMEYAAWMDFLIKVLCAIMQFDPAEINFNYGNSGQQSQTFGTPAAEKFKNSKDRGLRPLLTEIAGWINNYLIWPIDPNFAFTFLGLDEDDSDQKIKREKDESSYKKTVDEIRAEDDMEPLPDGKGAIILNPTWLQFAQGQDMARQGGQPLMDPNNPEGAPAEDPAQHTDGSAAAAAHTPLSAVMEGAADKDPGVGTEDFDAIFNKAERLKKSGTRRVRVYEFDL